MSQEGAEAEGRTKRQAKAPVWVQEGIDIDDALAEEMAEPPPTKFVFRLLQKEDMNRALVGRYVYVFWEDYDLWYRGKIRKIDFETMQAVIFYPDTEEEEPDADLVALANAKQLAFKESRPLEQPLGLNEVEHSKEFAAAEKRKRGRPPKGQERPRDPNAPDDGAYYDDFEDEEEPAPEESDPSYGSGSRKKRGKGGSAVDSKKGGARAGAGRGKFEEEDEEAEGQRLLAKAQGGSARPAGLQDDAAVRDKVRNAFTQVLEQAKGEQAPQPMAVPHPHMPMGLGGGMPGGMPFIPPALAAQMMAAGAFMNPQMAGMHPGGMPGMPMSMPMGMPAPVAPPAMVAPPPAPISAPISVPPQAPVPVPAPVAAPPAAEPAPVAAPPAVEAAPAEPAAELPKPAAVANVVEDELVRMYGGTTKDYKEKSRTLIFNLKGNKELRAHVLRGDITPKAFVRMTATELANKELAAYRVKKEEEALKMSVLDAEAAAKFSTAAALDARDTLAMPAAIVTDKLLAAREKDGLEGDSDDGNDRDQHGGAAGAVASPGQHGSGGPSHFQSGSPRTTGNNKLTSSNRHKDDHHDEHHLETGPTAAEKLTGAAAPPAAPAVAIDYASVRAQAQTNNTLPRLDSDITQTLEPFAAPGGSGSLGPSTAPGGGGGGKPKTRLPTVENLTRVFPPARSLSTLRPNIWSGSVVVPGIGEYTFTADALAGGHDLAALLGPGKLQVRGRLSITNLVKFLCELHLSRHRLAMLGVLRPLPNAGPADREKIKSLVASYVDQSRAGVGEPYKGVEVYLIPPGELSSRILEAGQDVEPEVAAGGAVARGVTLPTTLLEDQMLAMIVYKKDIKVPPAVPNMNMTSSGHMHHPGYPQSTVPMMSASAPAPAAGAPHAYSMVPGTAPLPMVGAGQMNMSGPGGGAPMQQPPPAAAAPGALPAGLDFSAISALAAAFGVAPTPSNGQGPSGNTPPPQ